MDEFIACELNLNKGIIQKKRCNYKEKEKGEKGGREGEKRRKGTRGIIYQAEKSCSRDCKPHLIRQASLRFHNAQPCAQ